MTRKEAIDFGEERLGLFGGKMEEFIKLSMDALKEQRPKGHWILKVKGLQITSYYCSECGRYVRDDTGYDVSKDYPFCHCGADMYEVAE